MAKLTDQKIQEIAQVLKSNPTEMQNFMSQIQSISQGGQPQPAEKPGFNLGRGLRAAAKAMSFYPDEPKVDTSMNNILIRELLERGRPKTAAEQLAEKRLAALDKRPGMVSGGVQTTMPAQPATQSIQTTPITQSGQSQEVSPVIRMFTGKYDEFTGEPIFNDETNPEYVGPKDRATMERQAATQSTKDMKARDIYEKDLKNTDVMLDTVRRIREGAGRFGLGAKFAVAGTDRANWVNEVNFFINNAIAEKMNEMKNQSQTGATGFGSLNEEELKVLRTAATKLQFDITPDRAREILDETERELMAIREKKQTLLQSGIGGDNWIGASKTSGKTAIMDEISKIDAELQALGG
jgi:hypothetical protein